MIIYRLGENGQRTKYYRCCKDGVPQFGAKASALELKAMDLAIVLKHLKILCPGATIGVWPRGARLRRKELPA